MAKRYKLNTYYDSMRALQRKMFTREFKKLSGYLKKFECVGPEDYRLIIAEINKGIYENMDKNIFDKSYNAVQTSETTGLTSNSNAYDFMSPIELRVNSIAIRLVINRIASLNKQLTDIPTLQEISYFAGQDASRELHKLTFEKGCFQFHMNKPIQNVKPILKQYNKALSKGNWITGDEVHYKDNRANQVPTLVKLNNKCFNDIKKLLNMKGFENSEIQQIFRSLNCSYYCYESPNAYPMEVSVLFEKNPNSKTYRYTELYMNTQKLNYFKTTLEKYSSRFSDLELFKQLAFSTGMKCRKYMIDNYKMYPEMFSGFYNICSYSEKLMEANKLVKPKTFKLEQDNKQKEKNK